MQGDDRPPTPANFNGPVYALNHNLPNADNIWGDNDNFYGLDDLHIGDPLVENHDFFENPNESVEFHGNGNALLGMYNVL